MGDRLRVADHLAAGAQQFDHPGLGAEDGLAGELGVGRLCGIRRQGIRRLRDDSAVAPDDGAVGQVEFAPPDYVRDIAEGADHGDAAALVFLGEVVREHRNFHPEDRRGDGGAEQPLVALVIRMRHERDTGRQQFRPRGLDMHIGPARAVEGDAVVGGGLVPVLEFGLGDCGAEGYVPQGRRVRLICLAAGQVAQECALRRRLGLLADGAVGLGPVDGQAKLAPDIRELFLVLGGQPLTQLNEVASADRQLRGCLAARARSIGRGAALQRRNESRVVRQARVAAHAVVVLHPAFGGQTVVVPAHRVEDALAAHALVARDEVHVGVAEHMPDVECTGCRRRGTVDREDVLGRRGGPIEPVGALAVPDGTPLGFQAFEGWLVRGLGHDGTPIRYVRHRVSNEVPECGVLTTNLQADTGLASSPRRCESSILLTQLACSTSAIMDAMTGTVGVRELRQQTSELIRRAEAGEEIIIAVSGRPAARLVPLGRPGRMWRRSEDISHIWDTPTDPGWDAERRADETIDQTPSDPWERNGG